jgi:hypothetical protein
VLLTPLAMLYDEVLKNWNLAIYNQIFIIIFAKN